MIHGQCIVRVLSDFKISKIIGIDNFTAENNLLKRIYQMAMPPQISGDIYSEEEAINEIKQQVASNEETLVLMKSPLSAVRVFKEIAGLPLEFNIGPMSSRKNTKKATLYAYLSDEEITALDELMNMGVRVYFNQVIDQRSDEWKDIRTNIK
jgi:mannose/fructose/N-acetylgalactosamine-specific phosphotransferase system component IIB